MRLPTGGADTMRDPLPRQVLPEARAKDFHGFLPIHATAAWAPARAALGAVSCATKRLKKERARVSPPAPETLSKPKPPLGRPLGGNLGLFDLALSLGSGLFGGG